MPHSTTSALALAALLAAGTAGGALAQATATDETAPAEEATEGEAEVIVIEEGEEEPAAEGEVVVEEELEGDTVITTDPAAEGEAATTEEIPAEGALVPEEEIVEEPAATDPVTTAPVADPAADPALAEEEAVVVEEVEQPVEGQILEQGPDQVMAETLLGATVASPEGETIGDVTDMVLSSEGQVEGVVVGVGGFLGIGEREVAMEFSQIEVVRDEAGEVTFVLNATREEIENAPEFRTMEEVQAEAGGAVSPGTTDGGALAPAPTTGTAPTGDLATDPAQPAAPAEGEVVIDPAD